MKKAILLLVLSFILVGCQSGGYESQTSDGVPTGEVKEFSAVISGFSYSPSSIKVNLGDTVRVNIRNNDRVTHGISLPVFGVREFVRPGETKTIQFVANQRGEPETFCSTDHGEKLLIEVI